MSSRWFGGSKKYLYHRSAKELAVSSEMNKHTYIRERDILFTYSHRSQPKLNENCARTAAMLERASFCARCLTDDVSLHPHSQAPVCLDDFLLRLVCVCDRMAGPLTVPMLRISSNHDSILRGVLCAA